jgi:hypothetical protein
MNSMCQITEGCEILKLLNHQNYDEKKILNRRIMITESIRSTTEQYVPDY